MVEEQNEDEKEEFCVNKAQKALQIYENKPLKLKNMVGVFIRVDKFGILSRIKSLKHYRTSQ